MATITAARGEPFYVVDVATGTPTVINISEHDHIIAHLGYLTDGSTASSAGDYIVVMNGTDTMAANLTAGRKLVVLAGGAAPLRGWDVSDSPFDKSRQIQIQAVGHSAKVQIVKGNLNGSQK